MVCVVFTDKTYTCDITAIQGPHDGSTFVVLMIAPDVPLVASTMGLSFDAAHLHPSLAWPTLHCASLVPVRSDC